MPMTKAFGYVEDRKPYEPAPLCCEAPSSCGIQMHTFVETRRMQNNSYQAPTFHDIYKCSKCGAERIWG